MKSFTADVDGVTAANQKKLKVKLFFNAQNESSYFQAKGLAQNESSELSFEKSAVCRLLKHIR